MWFTRSGKCDVCDAESSALKQRMQGVWTCSRVCHSLEKRRGDEMIDAVLTKLLTTENGNPSWVAEEIKGYMILAGIVVLAVVGYGLFAWLN